MSTDEDATMLDTTPYDFAERLLTTEFVSDAAKQEVADERWRVVGELIRISNGDGYGDDPEGNAKTLLFFKRELKKLVEPM